jgi:hypothetical protein
MAYEYNYPFTSIDKPIEPEKQTRKHKSHEPEEINIKELNLDIIYPSERSISDGEGGSKIFVIGKPRSGKSYLIRDLIRKKASLIPAAIAFNGTEEANKAYAGFLPDTFIYSQLELSKIDDVIKRQVLAIKHNMENPWLLMVIDDCFDNPKQFKSKQILDLIKNGRHYKMMIIIGLQYCLDVLPGVRTNIDGTFIFKDNVMTNRKKIWENYASIIPSFQLFNQIMDVVTNDYTALYIHNAGQSNNWQENVFWYKAKPVPKEFKFGSKQVWKYHKQRYSKEEKSEE